MTTVNLRRRQMAAWLLVLSPQFPAAVFSVHSLQSVLFPHRCPCPPLALSACSSNESLRGVNAAWTRGDRVGSDVRREKSVRMCGIIFILHPFRSDFLLKNECRCITGCVEILRLSFQKAEVNQLPHQFTVPL